MVFWRRGRACARHAVLVVRRRNARASRAGFRGVTLLERQGEPWRTVQGIEFRSVTVAAYKGKEGPCWDQTHAVVYGGPFRQVEDDDGHVLRRGVRTAVCEKTFRIFSQEPYRAHLELIPPRVLIQRHPRETKGRSMT